MYQKNKNTNNSNNKKEKTFYFTIQSNVRAISSATILSLNSSNTATATLLDDHRVPTTEQPDQTQDEYELILLVRSICEILGVTYLHETKSKLCCMITLQDVISTSNHHHHQIKKMSSTNTIGLHYSNDIISSTNSSSSPPNLLLLKKQQQIISNNSLYPNHINHSKEFNNDINDNTKNNNNNNNINNTINNNHHPNRWLNRQLHKLSLTQLRHTKSVQNLNLKYTSIERDQKQPQQQQQQKYENENNNKNDNDNGDDATNFKELNGLALFITEVNFVPTKQNDPRLLALKFIKVSGSTSVFELATGWITRILSSKDD